MSKWIAKLFRIKQNSTDIIRYIRTEYAQETRHLNDEDVLSYYEYITHKRRIK